MPRFLLRPRPAHKSLGAHPERADGRSRRLPVVVSTGLDPDRWRRHSSQAHRRNGSSPARDRDQQPSRPGERVTLRTSRVTSASARARSARRAVPPCTRGQPRDRRPALRGDVLAERFPGGARRARRPRASLPPWRRPRRHEILPCAPEAPPTRRLRASNQNEPRRARRQIREQARLRKAWWISAWRS